MSGISDAAPRSSQKLALTARVLAATALVVFLLTAFRIGWTEVHTDFPNYYTAAVMARQRQPLRRFYDWTWFQRQMNYAGTERQLGSYSAQTPLSMLPLLPLTYLAPQRAKQVWLICNLGFLGVVCWMLAQVTRFRIETVALLAFCGFYSLSMNFVYGQYYVVLLLLFTAVFYFLWRGVPNAAGIVAGLAFGLKLYGGPLLLYFLAKRIWKAAGAMAATTALLGAVALAVFGWAGVHYYLSEVLRRALGGSPIDPYSPGSPTIANLLRHVLVREPELNPHPLWHSPALFFFLRTLIPLGIAGILVMHLAASRQTDRRDFAWFTVATLLLTSSVGSYTYVLLLLPVALLLAETDRWQYASVVMGAYILLTMPLGPLRLFPKVWLLLFLFFFLRQDWRRLRGPAALAGAVAAALIALVAMNARMASYTQEPAQRLEGVAVEQGAIFSGYPAITRAGLFYQSLGAGRYVLRWVHDGRDEVLSFDGQAFRPWAPEPDGPIEFELVAHGTSRSMRFDPASGRAYPIPGAVDTADPPPRISPDGKWLAYTARVGETNQVWLRNRKTGKTRLLAGGRCESWAPVWELDSSAVVFASDCERGQGLPALYRAPVSP